MENERLDQSYRQLVEKSIASGAIKLRNNGKENRIDPRFHVNEGNLTVRIEPNFSMIDLSVSGLAFLSDTPFTPGKVITLYFEDTMGIQARVVGCFMIETDSDLLETRYRVQCKFEKEAHGKQVLMMMKEVDKLKA